MRIVFTRLALLLAAAGPWAMRPAQAQTVYVPATVTGYTADVVANGPGTVASSTTNTVDRGIPSVRWCFANTTYVNPQGISPTRALPANGFITRLIVQMRPYIGNNSLRINEAVTNALTPNTDEKNDVLHPNLANVTGYHLPVFSRWGRRVYKSHAAQGWTAENNSPGTCFYHVDYAGNHQNYKN